MILRKQVLLLSLGLICSFASLAQRPAAPRQPGQVSTSTTSNANFGTNEIVEALRYVNNLFDRYNEYNSQLNVDVLTNEVVFTDKFSELRGYVSEVEFRMSGENMGLFCKNGSECLRSESAKTGEAEASKVKYTFGVKQNDVAVPEASTAVAKLNSMLTAMQGGSSSTAYSNNSLSAVARKNLEIINDAFDKYNKYETVFSVQGKNLHWDSSVANVKAELKNLTFYIDYENNWMVMRCTSGECLEGAISKDSYSMSLSTDTGIAPNIEQVLQAFNDLRREILTN